MGEHLRLCRLVSAVTNLVWARGGEIHFSLRLPSHAASQISTSSPDVPWVTDPSIQIYVRHLSLNAPQRTINLTWIHHLSSKSVPPSSSLFSLHGSGPQGKKLRGSWAIFFPWPATSCLTDSTSSSPATAIDVELTSLLLFSFSLPCSMFAVFKPFTLLPQYSDHVMPPLWTLP